MSYVQPSVLVYEQLSTNSGVANVTPDLDSCIIGPCYNVVTYDTTSSATLLASWAVSQDGSSTISIASNASPLSAYLPSAAVGQIIDTSSLLVYLNNSQVLTETTKFTSHSAGTGGYTPNQLSISTTSGVTVNIQNNSKNITISSGSPPTFYVNDVVTITGAGPNDTDLTTTITSITDSTHFVVADNAKVGVAGSTNLALTRNGFYNYNQASATLRAEVGDTVTVANTNSSFTSTILSITSSNYVVSVISMADNLPTSFTSSNNFTITITKAYNNMLLPVSYSSNTNYTTTNLTSNGYISIQVAPQVNYGTVVAGEVHIQYRALRQDLLDRVLEINTIDDIKGTVGSITDQNPVALALELALANTTGRMFCITVASDDLTGYLEALDFSASQRMYCLVPLTQELDILEAFQQHVDQMSTPQKADWRIALVNSAIPSLEYIGQYSPTNLNANGGNNSMSASTNLLTSSNSTFVLDGVVPGDVLVAVTGGTPAQYVVQAVVSNQILQLAGTIPTATGFSIYVQRTLTKVQQANDVADTSVTFTDHRVFHIQPDLVGVSVNGVVKFLPGYYLCAAISGLVSGLPVQQGLTYIGIAGIADLQHSNFYFTRAQMDTMAAAGTFLVSQLSQGNIPYVRHSLSTDMSVLQYRELQQVKNIDFLAYYFYDKLEGFAGRWNITPDSLQALRATIKASGDNLKKQTLPKIGPPLLDYQIKSLAQDSSNLDQVNVELPVKIPTVMNYINLYLIV